MRDAGDAAKRPAPALLPDRIRDQEPLPHAALAIPAFLFAPTLHGAAFALLLGASAVIAFMAWRTDPLQRGVRHAGVWLLRLVAGILWWLQYVPPGPGAPARWTERAGMVPGSLAAALVHAVALLVAVSLALGLFTRLGALLAAAVITGLWLGVSGVGGDVGGLVLVMLLFVLEPPGRSLGLDAILLRQQARPLPFNWRRARQAPPP